MKIERLHAILLVLQKNEWTTAPDLAKIFNVTSRTIWRDVDELCRAGIPVLTKQGVKGGIALPSEFKQMYQEISIERLQSMFSFSLELLEPASDEGSDYIGLGKLAMD